MYRVGSRFCVNETETSQFSERHSAQMKATKKQKRQLIIGHTDISMIECLKYYQDVAFGPKRLCYERATAGTFILNLLYRGRRSLEVRAYHFIDSISGSTKPLNFRSLIASKCKLPCIEAKKIANAPMHASSYVPFLG